MLPERASEPQMQDPALAGQEVGVDRFSEQRMAKRVVGRRRVVGEQIVVDGLTERAVQIILGRSATAASSA